MKNFLTLLLPSQSAILFAVIQLAVTTHLLAADEKATQPTVSLPAPLSRVLSDYVAAWQKKDSAALATLFTDDGFVLANGTPPVRGRAEIAKYYASKGGPLALRPLAFA